MHVLRYGGLLALLLALAPAAARAAEPDASTRAAARKIALGGVYALQQDNAEVASQKLEKAFELLPAPSIALWSARALAKRGLLVEAAERYIQAGRLPPSEGNEQTIQAQAQKDAARELSELTPRIPRLVLALEHARPSEVQISMDGKQVSSALIGEEQPANPGAHKVTATRGSEQVEQSFNLAEGQRGQVVLRFQKLSPRAAVPPTSTKTPGTGSKPQWSTYASTSSTSTSSPAAAGSKGGGNGLAVVSLVLGGAGLVTGTVTGVLAMSKRSDLHNNSDCTGDRCLATVRNEVHNFRTLRTVSSIGFIAGGVFTATGIVLLLANGSSSNKGELSRPAVALRLAPGDVSLTGRF
jgi:hypothetical protein